MHSFVRWQAQETVELPAAGTGKAISSAPTGTDATRPPKPPHLATKTARSAETARARTALTCSTKTARTAKTARNRPKPPAPPKPPGLCAPPPAPPNPPPPIPPAWPPPLNPPPPPPNPPPPNPPPRPPPPPPRPPPPPNPPRPQLVVGTAKITKQRGTNRCLYFMDVALRSLMVSWALARCRAAFENDFFRIRQGCLAEGSLDRLPDVGVVIEPREQVDCGGGGTVSRHPLEFRRPAVLAG